MWRYVSFINTLAIQKLHILEYSMILYHSFLLNDTSNDTFLTTDIARGFTHSWMSVIVGSISVSTFQIPKDLRWTMVSILYKYGLVMRAIWSFMDLRQQYWPRLHLGQYCCRRSIKPILSDIIGQYLLYYMSNVYGSSTNLSLVYEYIYW